MNVKDDVSFDSMSDQSQDFDHSYQILSSLKTDKVNDDVRITGLLTELILCFFPKFGSDRDHFGRKNWYRNVSSVIVSK